jgi:hypothetical protein
MSCEAIKGERKVANKILYDQTSYSSFIGKALEDGVRVSGRNSTRASSGAFHRKIVPDVLLARLRGDLYPAEESLITREINILPCSHDDNFDVGSEKSARSFFMLMVMTAWDKGTGEEAEELFITRDEECLTCSPPR